MKNNLIAHSILLILILGLIIFMASLSAMWRYYIKYDYTVQVTDGQQIIYQGSAACVNYQSAGATTVLRVNKPFFWCSLLQDREYVSNSIIVKPIKG